jgi:hypothetical protein
MVAHQWEILHQVLNNLLARAHELELAMLRAAAVQPASRHLHARKEVIPELQLDWFQFHHRNRRALCELNEKL